MEYKLSLLSETGSHREGRICGLENMLCIQKTIGSVLGSSLVKELQDAGVE